VSAVIDSAERAAAIDALRSFCVSAPAGSGKTELLIQRYLVLLTRVRRPEQVLAITFTRKAAAEMRERVLRALRAARDGEPCDGEHQRVTRQLAQSALAADRAGDWQLLRDTSRLNIKTIDSFCAGLTRQMPLLSLFGGQASPREDATPLYEEAVTELFALLDSGHAVETDLRRLLLHFDNNWGRLQQLFVDMLHRRDQWQKYIGVHEAPLESERYLMQVVESLVCNALREVDALLSPYREEILELQRFAAGNLGTEQLEAFPDTDAAALWQWRQVRDLLLTQEGQWRKAGGVNKKYGFPADKTGEPAERKAQMLALLAELEDVQSLEGRLAAVGALPELDGGGDAWQLALCLSRLLPVLSARLLLVFSRHGEVDYSQLIQSALHALGDDEAPTELALRLDYRIEHLLVDEFQDTSINQYELLRKLTRGWGEHNAANLGAPRTLLVVGDAQQSIYGFRDANVGLFQRVWQQGFNGVVPEHLVLRSNFRSYAGIVDWVNDTFGRHFPDSDDIASARVSYSPASAARGAGADNGEAAVTLDAFTGEDADSAEVEFICARIAACVEAGESDIGVLARQRSHLRPLSRRLKELRVPCHAQDLDSLAQAPLAMDLLTLCRALANDADRVAWMALLRAPWCGLGLSDLLALARYETGTNAAPLRVLLHDEQLDAALSADGRQRLQHVRAVLHRARAQRDRLALRVWVEQAWLGLGGPGCSADPLALQDAESFLALLEEADSEGIGLDIAWLERQVARKFMSGGDPDCPVHLMTLHRAKGLEFERVFIPRLSGRPRGDTGDLLRWDEQTDEAGEPVFLLAAYDGSKPEEPTLYRYLGARRKLKQDYEATRLLYVGATRAITHLHLSARIRWDDKKDAPVKPASTSLLATIWDSFAGQMRVHHGGAGQEVTAPVPRLARQSLDTLPVAPAGSVPAPPPGNFPDRPENHFERGVGTVVHLALEALSLLAELPHAATQEDRRGWRRALAMQGLAGEALERALRRVAASVESTLAGGGAGRWLLSSAHPGARSEWALTVARDDGFSDMVIDRTFVDADSGVRWVVDYKTSRPADGEALAAFVAREADHYREQLAEYRDALRALGDEPVVCALYFTALDHLHSLDELALPAKQTT